MCRPFLLHFTESKNKVALQKKKTSHIELSIYNFLPGILYQLQLKQSFRHENRKLTILNAIDKFLNFLCSMCVGINLILHMYFQQAISFENEKKHHQEYKKNILNNTFVASNHQNILSNHEYFLNEIQFSFLLDRKKVSLSKTFILIS